MHNLIITFNITVPMDPSTSMTVANKEVEQLRASIDETSAEVAEASNKFSHQEDLVDAFNDNAVAVGYAAAIVIADKFEARMVAARARHETTYNRYAATIKSTNKTVTVIARKAFDEEVDAKANDNKFPKTKLKEPNERKDHTGQNQRKHLSAFTACK